ncbi:MAG: class I SAM-dependent methyltransferase [Ferruginibacter sp.]
MKSPITGSEDCTLIESFNSATITQKYAAEFNMEVSRYFAHCPTVQLYQCNQTGYRFYYPFDIYADGAFYAQLNSDNKGYYKKDRWEHTDAIRFVAEGKNMLEVGCGDGAFLKMAVQKKCTVTGLELNDVAIQQCVQDGLNVIGATIEEHATTHPAQYDVVVFFQVLEHITNISSFVGAAITCLKPGGTLIIGVPNNNPYIFRHDKWHTLNLPPHHAGLWSTTSLSNLQEVLPLSLTALHIEPLYEYKTWYQAHITHFKETAPFKATLLSLVPRFIYKSVLALFRNAIAGRNIVAIYSKK